MLLELIFVKSIIYRDIYFNTHMMDLDNGNNFTQ